MPDVIALGAGIVGMTTAWELARDGDRVTWSTRRQDPLSHANGGQFSYSYDRPVNRPLDLATFAPVWFGPPTPTSPGPGPASSWSTAARRASLRPAAVPSTKAFSGTEPSPVPVSFLPSRAAERALRD